MNGTGFGVDGREIATINVISDNLIVSTSIGKNPLADVTSNTAIISHSHPSPIKDFQPLLGILQYNISGKFNRTIFEAPRKKL